jgi:UDP-N-acetylglucosamine 2-epimerase (non-hydrolysing)
MRFTHVVGARPNFMKAAPVFDALKQRRSEQVLVHTGQHYDELMSDLLFRQLDLPVPDINLGVGSGSHAQQTGAVLTAVEKVLMERRPDVLIVYGDVNSTMAATLAAAKLGVPVAHVESGLRSFDRTMPEEINRIVTDRLADYLLTPSADGDANLLKEGVPADRIFRVGNVMIDTLIRCLPLADARSVFDGTAIRPGDRFVLVTLHRPANVDSPGALAEMMAALQDISEQAPVIFPMHPRTRARLGSANGSPTFHLVDPVGYLEFIALEKSAALVITDSGGVQEETTYLGVPCLTVRPNTERPVTITHGTNVLIGTDPQLLLKAATEQLSRPPARRGVPELWDGHAAERIADVLTRVDSGRPA